ncbi:M28 family metallopeptidase [Sphingomonas crocodyli]|uniref:M28 family peptidase n=1 Tax=Sphingomonas crocodyli TaxID=1979270 RepID=A0A437M5D5_9SPHN|nr:M28 family metallopeptidase [Sphingomonas crocodyli]RVT92684.1 M28 family peptidase [Sphingomonas crocodyli]
MPSLRPTILSLLMLGTASTAAIPEPTAQRIDAWWGHIATIASDKNEGRLTGSAGYDRAADYVVSQFTRLRLIPAGSDGWFQPVELTEQRFDQAASKAVLIGPAGPTPLATPTDLYFRGSAPMPPKVDAPLVFAGYGLSIPEAGHDDFAGLDLKGKIVVVLSGGPAEISGALKSDARSRRAAILAERGAIGLIALTTPKQTEIKWDRQVALSGQPFMYPSDTDLREIPAPFLNAFVGPDAAPKLFVGASQDFAALSALADASKPLPTFALPQRLAATIVSTSRPVHAKNIVARLPGSDPVLSAQNVVLSAHLDGLGVGAPIKGDTIYNGAFDNAVGVSTLIETAKALTAFKKRPRRSILFVIVTGEEKGLLGSRHFAARPTVPAASLVADINLDMPLPIFAFSSVTPIGYEESSLGENAKAVAASLGLPVLPDPKPDRNVFIRSDQYSFIRKGVPSLFLKYGFKLGTPEEKIEADWRANIYHSPQDDLDQPAMKAEGVKFTDYVIALARNVADDPAKPSWNADSYFKRFAK